MMKRRLCALLAAALLCGLWPCALAAGEYSRVEGTYELSSGVGAWRTELTVDADGGFSGDYRDDDMGTGGDLNGTPYQATVYRCVFTGRLSKPEIVGDHELDCRIEALEWEQLPTWVADGVLNVTTSPSGLNQGDRLRFFTRGAEVSGLPEGFLVWVRMREGGIAWESLPYGGLYNETADAGFSSSGAGSILWLPGAGDGAAAGTGQWEFITGDGEPSPAPQATAVPSPLRPGAGESDAAAPEDADPGRAGAGDSDEAPEGIAYPVRAVVVNCQTGVSLRAQPSTRAKLLAEVPLGASVSVHSNRAWQGNDRWFVEASYDGLQGYICVEYLDILLPDDLGTRRSYMKGMKGSVSAVNPGSDLVLRAGPGTDYDCLGLLFGGEVLGYRGEAKRDASGTCWYRCSHYGEDCWISARYTVLTLNDGKSYTGRRGIF